MNQLTFDDVKNLTFAQLGEIENASQFMVTGTPRPCLSVTSLEPGTLIAVTRG
ncbi:hypothetical protein [Cupriavidus basilensis]|uniref:hypothetical protein n=1 Tax=Cupriavidus basilensis TaxID=68895 RepID=UPI0039F6B69D